MPTLTMRRFIGELTRAANHDRDLPSATHALLHTVADHPRLLTPGDREPNPDHYRQHVVHADLHGRFSVLAVVWLPGQTTPIHDHVAWCATAVLCGQET